MMQRRKLGGTDVDLSLITLGSMRFANDRLTSKEAYNLLSYLIDQGVTSFHTSHEYSTHQYFTETLRRYKVDHPAKKFQHIIKLGEPHFDSNFFCPNRFRTIIEQQLIELQTDCIDIVQWL